jgi:hypothetical protein
MSLIVDIKINKELIINVKISRINPLSDKPMGELCTYIVESKIKNKPWKNHGEIQHWYDDGAEILLEKALQLINKK